MLLQLRAWLLVPAILLPVSAQHLAKTEPTKRPQVMETYGKLPLSFEANQGQSDSRVKFLSRGSGYTLFLTQDSAVLSLHGKKTNAALRMKVIGANPHAAVAGTDGLPGKSNYFVGNDPSQWRTNVPTYASVKYSGVYPGIDLVYHGNQRLLEYDFRVAPGADPNAIELRFQGAKKLGVNDDGALVIGIGDDEVIEHAPVVYQEIAGQRKTLPGRYVLRGKGRVAFSIANYDHDSPLVIDPALVNSTYLGGSYDDRGLSVAIDSAGNAYVTGAAAVGFPTTEKPFATTSSYYNMNVFVAKLNADLSALIYSVYLGTNGAGYGIAVDKDGNAYVVGNGLSVPTTPGAFQSARAAGGGDMFVTKLNTAGSALVYSTYLCGSGFEVGHAIAVDASGQAYVTGRTYSDDFPTSQSAYQAARRGGVDAFVSKLNAEGSALLYSTYLGGSGFEESNGITLDSSDNAYITGETSSPDFPTTAGALQAHFTGLQDAFVSKLSSNGSVLVYSTYVGGEVEAQGNAIAVDALGQAFFTGWTNSSDFPTTEGAFGATMPGTNPAFVSKVDSTGSTLLYSTYLGGNCSQPGWGTAGNGIAVDADGHAYITGSTGCFDFPTTSDASQTSFGGDLDAFVTKLSADGSALLYSTYLGGGFQDSANSIVVDTKGNAYVTGLTESPDFPSTPGAFQTTYVGSVNGGGDAFVATLSLGDVVTSGPLTVAVLSGVTGVPWFLSPVTVTLKATGSNPISATYYRLDGDSFQVYLGPFLISTDGTHGLSFYSVDAAGSQETPHGQTIKIDATAPVSHVAALPGTASSPNFSVQWTGSDATSGLLNYTIYVSDNGSPIVPWAPWLYQTTATRAWFRGYLGHTYRFYSVARDVAGNVEVKTVPDATTTVPAQMAADVNGDGQINCTDIAIVKASFGKRTGQTGFDPRADVNHDGIVDVRDLAAVSQKLIPGTTCP